MLTIVETPTFQRLWPDYWTEEERGEFATWLALANIPATILRELKQEIENADD